MADFDFNIQQLLFPLIYLVGSVILGIFIEKIILKRMREAAYKTRWKGDDIILNSFRGIIVFWSITAGSFLFIHHLPFQGSLIKIGDKIIFSAVVLSASVLAGRMLVGFIRAKTSDTAGLLPSSSIIANITRVIVFIIGVLVILQTFGISVTPILTALGVGGLAVALALQETLSNLFAGIQVIASQQIRTGNYIKLDTGEEGYVVDITWRSTTIRALPNNLIIVPNSKIASVIVTNYNLPDKEMAVLVDVGVSYSSDLSQVEQITIQTAKEVIQTAEGGAKDFTPFIRYHTFGESSINFTVILRAQEFVNQYVIKHEFVKALHRRFKENNIEIPFPIRTVHLKQNK